MEIIAAAVEEKKYNAGVVVIKQGDQGDNLYIVESGTLSCVKKIVTIYLSIK